MATPVTLSLPDQLYEQAERWAALTNRDMTATLLDALSVALTPVHTAPPLQQPVSELSDDDVLALTSARLEPSQGRRLSRLLARQREGALSSAEGPELAAIMQVYSQLWVRQSEALAEAVHRGIREPVSR